jgi:hypothetical protein
VTHGDTWRRRGQEAPWGPTTLGRPEPSSARVSRRCPGRAAWARVGGRGGSVCAAHDLRRGQSGAKASSRGYSVGHGDRFGVGSKWDGFGTDVALIGRILPGAAPEVSDTSTVATEETLSSACRGVRWANCRPLQPFPSLVPLRFRPFDHRLLRIFCGLRRHRCLVIQPVHNHAPPGRYQVPIVVHRDFDARMAQLFAT